MLSNYNKLDYFGKNFKKAIINLKSSNYSLAHKYIYLLMRVNENAPEWHNLLGILSEIKGDLILAGKHYRASYALDPTYKPASKNLYRITCFYYKFDKESLDYGDNRKRRILWFILLNMMKKNIGHLNKKE
ncbi:hypothetical protein EXQ39_07335 [Clostridium botulinum]|nr:hypothetical protein [Clostridium botulinum]